MNNTKVKLLHICGLFIILIFLTGCNLTKDKVYHIGILSGVDSFSNVSDGFKSKMTELGYVEGENIIYNLNKINPGSGIEDKILNKFVTNKVDLILVFPSSSVLKAKDATINSKTPLIFAITTLDGLNLVDSVSKPGGHITGVQTLSSEIVVTRFEFLLEIKPSTKKVYVSYKSDYTPAITALKELRKIAIKRNVELIELPITSIDELKEDLNKRNKLKDIGVDAIFILPDIITPSSDAWEIISNFALIHKIPIVGSSPLHAYNGAIFTFSPDNFKVGTQAAIIADKIFKGTPAGEIKVETAEPILIINTKIAKELGLNIPEGLLSRADKLIR